MPVVSMLPYWLINSLCQHPSNVPQPTAPAASGPLPQSSWGPPHPSSCARAKVHSCCWHGSAFPKSCWAPPLASPGIWKTNLCLAYTWSQGTPGRYLMGVPLVFTKLLAHEPACCSSYPCISSGKSGPNQFLMPS